MMSKQDDIRILLVGFGNMGRALARGWLDAGMSPASVCVADDSAEARDEAAAWGLRLIDPLPYEERAAFDILVLAVKPQQTDAAIAAHLRSLSDDGVVLSIAAGKTLASLQHGAGRSRGIVRSMPNTPAAIARGTTVMVANEAVSAEMRTVCERLLKAVGAAYWVEEEAMLDAVTAVSGSGPAYVFLLIECLTAAGVRQGLPEELAAELALNTVAGAGAYALDSPTPVDKLREQVTSPGGTTAAALGVFMHENALQNLVDEAVAAAAARSEELSAE
jgi:pyrroline-5-carboxylate reductase